MGYPISKDEIIKAHKRIQAYIHETPVLSSELINEIAECQIYFKCENFQKIGAFKIRGATNAILQLSEEKRQYGIVTHSSGNHAQAVAKAARELNCHAYIVMPENAPKVKVAAVKNYGGEIIFCKANQQARENTVQTVIDEKKAAFIHPYDDYEVIAGQASAAKELIKSKPNLDAIICPVGGGGLLAGTILSAAYFGENLKVYAGEPKGADDAYRSLKEGKILPSENPKTIADGLLTSLGKKNFEIIEKGVQQIIRVTDDEIIQAMRLIWERMKIIVEPSCAVPLAAIFKSKSIFQDKKVGLILSGGNVDLDDFFKRFN